MTKQRKDNEPTVSPEDIEAGAYFPEAKDWIEIGRRRLKYQTAKYIQTIYERSSGRYKFTFPLDTDQAFLMVGGLGYRAKRKDFDYCIVTGTRDRDYAQLEGIWIAEKCRVNRLCSPTASA